MDSKTQIESFKVQLYPVKRRRLSHITGVWNRYSEGMGGCCQTCTANEGAYRRCKSERPSNDITFSLIVSVVHVRGATEESNRQGMRQGTDLPN